MASLAILVARSIAGHRSGPRPSMRIGWNGSIVEAGSIVSRRTDAGEPKPEERTQGR